jgi:hypothetical protein
VQSDGTFDIVPMMPAIVPVIPTIEIGSIMVLDWWNFDVEKIYFQLVVLA